MKPGQPSEPTTPKRCQLLRGLRSLPRDERTATRLSGSGPGRLTSCALLPDEPLDEHQPRALLAQPGEESSHESRSEPR